MSKDTARAKDEETPVVMGDGADLAPGTNGHGLTADQQAEVDAEWAPGTDGILQRDAARVILLDVSGRVLLVEGHDVGDKDHRWWFTVGGGIGRGEGAVDGARRELAEETGIELDTDRLIGPVLKRRAMFHFALETRRQHEVFYVARLSEAEVSAAGQNRRLTALELDVLDGFQWWYPDEIRAAGQAGQTFYPLGLADLIESLDAGWDGSCPEVWEE